METKQKTPEGKTGAEIVLEWMRKYSEQNGTPTEFEIRCQLELAIDAEKLHHQEANAGQTKELEKYSAIEKAVEIASKNVTSPKVVREGIVTPISEQSSPVSLEVEQAANDYAADYSNPHNHKKDLKFSESDIFYIRQSTFKDAIKWQSQQPASIQWLSDEEINQKYPSNEWPDDFNTGKRIAAKEIQSELRKRVIDPVGFAEWISGCMYDRIIVKEGEDYVYRGWTDGHETVAESTEELLQIYLTSK